MQFEVARPYSGEREALWMRVSDVEDVPKYWHGTKELAVISKSGDVTRAKVRFAFGGTGIAEYEVRQAERAMVVKYVKGPFVGTQTIWLDEAGIRAKWDVRLHGVFEVVSRWNEGHFREGSIHALDRLCQGLEGSPQGRRSVDGEGPALDSP